MSVDIINQFFKATEALNYKKNELVIDTSKKYSEIYLIKKGYVKASFYDSASEKVIAIYKSGEIFPLISTLKKQKRNLQFTALGEVELYQRRTKDFHNLLQSNHKAALAVIDKMASFYEIYLERIDNLVQINSHEKIIARLLFFAKRFGETTKAGTLIQAPITQALIASSTAVTRETVNRELKKLKDLRLIKIINHKIQIADLSKLASLSAFIPFDLIS